MFHPALLVHSLPQEAPPHPPRQPPAQDRNGQHPAPCTPQSGGLSGRLAIPSPLTQGAQEGLRLAKKTNFLKATAKTWCAFVFLIPLVLCYLSSDDAFKCLPCGPKRFTSQQEGSFCYGSSTNDQWTGMWSQGGTAFFFFQEATRQCLRILYLAAWPVLLSGF